MNAQQAIIEEKMQDVCRLLLTYKPLRSYKVSEIVINKINILV